MDVGIVVSYFARNINEGKFQGFEGKLHLEMLVCFSTSFK